ncbi:hypothetical protein ACHAW6_005054 [Cyclotella cf. meneghiniana]
MINESDSGRKVANETAFEYSTDITKEHTKKSEELPASSDTGLSTVQNAESGGFEMSTNVMPEVIIPPSETLAAKPLLQSNTFINTPKPQSEIVAPPVVKLKNTTSVSNHTYAGTIAGLATCLMGIFVFAGAILARNHRQKNLRKSRNASKDHSGQHLAAP